MTACKNAVMGQGLPPEVPWVIFPYALYLADSDVAGIIGPKMDEIIRCLTTWQPETTYTTGQLISRDPIKITGKTYTEAYRNLQNSMLSRNLGDGWPVNPATQEAVQWMMTGVPAGKKLGDPIGNNNGKVPPKRGVLTYEVLAACMVMAGGRPEYMPVAIAVSEIIVAVQDTILASSMSAYPIIMVNGPIARQIRLSSGFGLFGPDPSYPAGSAIKRCIWLVHQNVGGLIPGGGTIAQYGFMRPGICFAENEDGLPPEWLAYAEERYQRPRGTDSVTYGLSMGGAVRAFVHRGTGGEPSHKIELNESFDRFASTVKSIPTSGVPRDYPGSRMIWLMNAAIARDMVANGYDKESIKTIAAERLWYLLGEVIDSSGVKRSIEERKTSVGSDLLKKFQLCTDPQNIHLFIAGGDHPSASCVIPNWAAHNNVEIVRPENWDQLLADADRDLGPIL